MLPMKRSRLSQACLLFAAAVAATVSLDAAARDRPEPFVAAAQIAERLQVPNGDAACQPTVQNPGLTGSGTITGTGLANVVGAFTVTSTDCIRSNVPGQFFPPYTFSSSTFTLTAANGDQIVATYGGNAELSPLGLLVLTGTYTITGGTGQFRDASGSGTLAGVENIATDPARGFVTLTGQISR